MLHKNTRYPYGVNASFTDNASFRNKLNVYLYSLTGIEHLLVRFWYVFGIGWFNRHLSLFAVYAVKTCNRTSIASLTKLNPKHNKSGIGATAAHISNQFQLISGMLIGMMVVGFM